MLSYTLIIYNNDSPHSVRDENVNLAYADYITLLISHQGNSQIIALRAMIRDVEHQKKLEDSWKMTTKATKFTIVKLGTRIHDIATNGENLLTEL